MGDIIKIEKTRCRHVLLASKKSAGAGTVWKREELSPSRASALSLRVDGDDVQKFNTRKKKREIVLRAGWVGVY
jgi:hypothetical protein